MLSPRARPPRVYIYVVDRDFGFAPNPFHGICTLACCKERMRSTAEIGDWVIGMGGSRLKATGRCVYGMKITNILTFEEYWAEPRFFCKKPVRNGSRIMMVGDNIYCRENESSPWNQTDSHHSFPDGSPNLSNITKDTKTNRVLISDHFIYFGRNSLIIPESILRDMGYRNQIGYRVFTVDEAHNLLKCISGIYDENPNAVIGDPYDFRNSDARYSAVGNKVIRAA